MSEFINKKIGKEKGKELFKKYSVYANIIKDGIHNLISNIETIRTSAIGRMNVYLEPVDRIKTRLTKEIFTLENVRKMVAVNIKKRCINKQHITNIGH